MSIRRIVTIDILRGFFIFMIIVDHLERFPSGFDFFTGRGLLWMSAAEGFFFLSGVMIGIIRGRKESNEPFAEVAHKLLKRALILFAWTIGMTLVFTWLAHLIGPNPNLKADVWQGGIVQLLLHSATLQYVYSWADFLRYYAVYLVLSIAAIPLLRANKAWIIAVMSIVAWLVGRHTTQFLTWQLLFFGGVLAGWYWHQLTRWFGQLPKIIVALHYPVALLMVAYSILVVFGPYQDLHNQLAPYFLRAEMPILRVAMFILWFSALYRFVRSHESLFARTVGKLLIPLGQNSLYAYILHGIIIFFVHLWIPKGTSLIVNFIITASVLAVIWAAIKARFLFGFIPR